MNYSKINKQIKKILSVSILGGLLLLPAVAQGQFSDVEDENLSRALEYVRVTSEGYARNEEPCINGYGDGTFKPDRAVSRMEVAKLVLTCIPQVSLNKEQEVSLKAGDKYFIGDKETIISEDTILRYEQTWRPPAPQDDPQLDFSDVDYSQWYAPFLQEAVYRDYIKGANGQVFPNRQVTLAEFLTIVLRIHQSLDADYEVDLASLPDYLSETEWYAPAIAFGLENKLISTQEDSQLAVFYELDRAETAILIYNYLLIASEETAQVEIAADGITDPVNNDNSDDQIVEETTAEDVTEVTNAESTTDEVASESPSDKAPDDWQIGDTESGVASYYGDSFEGKQTASGQTLTQFSFLAAHKTLPFGSRIKVINPESQRFIIATVVDRGPFVEGRILDLTKSAFAELENLSAGLVAVELEVLSIP